MSQNNNPVNFIIREANGKSQMVKIVQNLNFENKGHPNIKFVNFPIASGTRTEIPVLRAVRLTNLKCDSKLVQVPIEKLAGLKSITPQKEVLELQETLEDTCENTENILEEKHIESIPEAEQASQNINKTEISTTVDERPELVLKMSHATKRRHDSETDTAPEYTTKRRRNADRVGKGLRHFSMKVCEKVRTKGFTSYNEVADELVLEFSSRMHGSSDSQQYDQKNIRRRVYDALNVLMAMNIISKEKKEIRWLGLPTNSIQECTSLEKEKQTKIEKIQKKTQQLQELILQHISFRSLIERNKESESKGVKPSPSSAIHLPFIVVNTSDKALIDCSISNDKSEYMFNFNKRFQIHDDIDILKRMGLLFGLDKGECSEEEIEKAKSMVPKSLEYYVEQMGRGLSSKLSTILEEEDLEENIEEEFVAHDADEDVQEGQDEEFSEEEISDVDV